MTREDRELRRVGDPGFVGIPANSPSIMALGAVDNTLDIAFFSARSSGLEGGQVDITGPGVDFSAAEGRDPARHDGRFGQQCAAAPPQES